MKTRLFAFGGILLVSTALSATLPELLQKAKDHFKTGAHAEALAALTELETASAQPGLEKDRAALAPIIAFYRGASLASLGRKDEARAAFAIFLEHQPNASLDPAVYSKKVIAALEDARKTTPPAEPPSEPSMEAAYRSFAVAAAAAQAEDPGADWADGPVRHLVSASERQEYAALADPASRGDFVTAFWSRRDPRPETSENELRAEFEKRVAFADSRFTQGETRGSMTDRGMVFILLGPPTYIGRKPLTAGEDSPGTDSYSRSRSSDARIASSGEGRRSADGRSGSSQRVARLDRATGPGRPDAESNWREVWHYRKERLPAGVPYLQVDFDFVTKRGYGENVLQREAQTLDTLERARAALRRAE